MTEREKILGRIAEGLRTPAPLPGSNHEGAALSTDNGRPQKMPPGSAARQWLPKAGETMREHLELFGRNATDLKADFRLANSREELARILLALRDAEGWKKIGIHSGELTDFAAGTLALPMCRTDQGYGVRELESCDAGITECDALVAQTGSVLLTSRSAGGRALSVLPPHHVVLARREQLIADLPEAFALLRTKYASSFPSFISFTTGPSRTGDIERILVLGAHGPKKLTILCI